MIEELPVGPKAPVNPAAPGQLDKEEILTQPPSAEVPMKGDRETCCNNTSKDLKNCQKTYKLSKLCSEAGFRLVEIGQFFHALPSPRAERNQSLCREKRCLEIKKELVSKGGSKAMYNLDPSRT